MAPNDFDPLAYIESAFSDTKKEVIERLPREEIEVEVPTLNQFLNGHEDKAKPAERNGVHKTPAADKSTKFRKLHLSAPRPRMKKSGKSVQTLDPALHDIWASLPKNIHFLSSFFDDAVTSNYYRGEFRESREELIQRILDPELTLEEVSRLLGVCPATVRRYTNRGWLNHHRTQGGQRRFRLSGVVRFVDEHGRHPEG